MPDGTQDLHIELAGLSSTSLVASVEVTDSSGDVWQYPDTGSAQQIVFDRGNGATTADIFIQPKSSRLDDTFTIYLEYANESGAIDILVQGVLFNPTFSVLPTVAQAPLGLAATAVTSSHVTLSWAAVPGASSYVVERSLASATPAWSVIATGVIGTSYTDTTVTNSTAYDYTVSATSAPTH